MELNRAFGVVLREERKKVAISQEELAHQSDLDRTYISLLERGKRNSTLKVLFSLCDALNISPSDFVKEMEKYIKSNLDQ
ncbi:MAG TPA: helix-turn-helix transcriptional regulator [Pseudogracilibacillus sp.]|nr:helix-turn-helix transcriptional regulator [Pseudogracilibacillus sp.]